VANAPSERAIAASFMESGPGIFGVRAIGFYSMQDDAPKEMHILGLRDSSIELYERFGRLEDPLLETVLRQHAPAAISVAELRRTGPVGYRAFLEEERHLEQYMLAPIVVAGEIAGMMHFARAGESFSSTLQRAFALSLHVSTRVAVLRAADGIARAWDGALTRRELEIAELIARGGATADVARAAGVSPNTVKKHLKALYQKLGVCSRAELGAALLRGPRVAEETARRALPAPRVMAGGAVVFEY